MFRSPKLQKRTSDPEGRKIGCSQNCTIQIFLDLESLAHVPKLRVHKHPPPCGPLRVQLPIIWFFGPEGEWGSWIGKGVCPAVCILGGGYGNAHRMYVCEGLSQKKRVALRAPPG